MIRFGEIRNAGRARLNGFHMAWVPPGWPRHWQFHRQSLHCNMLLERVTRWRVRRSVGS